MKSLAAFVAGTALALSANAGVVSFSFDNAQQTTPISQTIVLGLFDSSFGTLTGVALNLSGSSTTTLSLTNTASQPQSVSFTATTNLFFGSSLGALSGLLAGANPLLSLSANGFGFLSPNEPTQFGPLLASQPVAPDVSSILSSLSSSGGGPLNITCTSRSSLTFPVGVGNITSTQATQADCDGSITYTFTTNPPSVNRVPEPTSLALMGLALAGLGLMRRKADKA